MALKDAKWTNEEIAAEMHMTKVAVAQAVSRCRSTGRKEIKDKEDEING